MVRRLAFFGPEGTYTEEAARLYDTAAELQSFTTIAGVVQAVTSQLTETGIVPIENSLEGSVTSTLDLLIREPQLSIYQEVVLPINHHIMVKPGTSVSDIQVVYSHPQSLAQCREFLERCFPHCQQMASLSNSAAVADMKESLVPAAAIAPRRAAEVYGVEVIGHNIQDVANNVTRFAVLARQDHPPTGDDKTSICFSFSQDAPGLLYGIMGEFAQRNINLVKIESRPSKQMLGEYIFLIDCIGHREDAAVGQAIEAIRSSVDMCKVLGSYPRWSDAPK